MIGEQKHWLQDDGKRKEGDILVVGTYQMYPSSHRQIFVHASSMQVR